MSKNNKKNQEVSKSTKANHILLKFDEDVFYAGKPAYSAGVHEVSLENGWAARWMARGAYIVDSVDSEATSSVMAAPEVPVDPVAVTPDVSTETSDKNADKEVKKDQTGDEDL